MYLNVLQSQWAVMALIGGIVLVLIIATSYLLLWRSREEVRRAIVEGEQKGTRLSWFRSFFPWALLFFWIVVIAYAIGYVLYVAKNPQNW